MKLLARRAKRSEFVWLTMGAALLALIAVLDLLTGYELAFSLFYLLPIALVAWFTGWRAGLLTALFGAVAWFLADYWSGHSYSHPIFFFWNTLIRLGFFLVVALLLARLRTALETARKLSQSDPLTGAANTRYFYQVFETEIERARRSGHPLTIAYLDLDNFKTVNDTEGHHAGDRALTKVVETVNANLRQSDLFARVGGDEFILLLAETGQEGAQSAMTKIERCLLQEMERLGLPITFSVGVVTLTHIPSALDEIIRHADNLMYVAKREGKNRVKYCIDPNRNPGGVTDANAVVP